jgi:hypothetical protein
MFASAMEVDSGHWKSVYEWLAKWGREIAIVTTPLLCQTTPRNTVLYGVPNDINIHPFAIIPFFDMTEQFLQQSGYTVISGFTLALALHRLGVWPEDIFHKAMVSWFSEFSMEDPWTEMSTAAATLFFQHPVPHVCDHPLHYAVMGKDKASLHVVKTMKRWMYSFLDDPFTMFHTNTQLYYTTLMSTMFPIFTKPYAHLFARKWSQSAQLLEDEDDVSRSVTSDLGGFIVSITNNRARWNWWEKNHQQFMHLLRSSSIDAVFKRIFYLYAHANEYNVCHSRLRKLWNQMLTLEPAKKTYTSALRVLLISCTQSRVINVQSDYWYYEVPIAFMKDFRQHCGIKLNDKHTFQIMFHERHEGMMNNLFQPYIVRKIPLASRENYFYLMIEISMLQLIRAFPRDTSISNYSLLLNREIAKSLWSLKKGFYDDTSRDENKNYTLWMILDTHLRDNIDSWI